MLKFSKKPGDDFLIPIATVSIFAFIFLIIQITIANLLIENSNLVFIIYFLPILFLSIIISVIFLDNINLKRLFNAK